MFQNLISLLRFLLNNRPHWGKIRCRVSSDQFELLIEPEDEHTSTMLLQAIKNDIDAFWRTVPFNTLFLNYKIPVEYSPLGGTCSDRAVLFFERLQNKYGPSLNARLHRARIKDQETHTVILIDIHSDTYLIDIGSNWPVMQPIPCFEPYTFNCFGISFRSHPDNSQLNIEMKRPEHTEFRPFLKVNLNPQSVEHVAEALKARHENNGDLPLAENLRFSFVHEDTFYALRESTPFGKVAHRRSKWSTYHMSDNETQTNKR